MNKYLAIMIRYRNLTNFISVTEYSSTYCLFLCINHMRGVGGKRVAQSLQWPGYRQLDIKQGKGAFILSLAWRSEQKPT